MIIWLICRSFLLHFVISNRWDIAARGKNSTRAAIMNMNWYFMVSFRMPINWFVLLPISWFVLPSSLLSIGWLMLLPSSIMALLPISSSGSDWWFPTCWWLPASWMLPFPILRFLSSPSLFSILSLKALFITIMKMNNISIKIK